MISDPAFLFSSEASDAPGRESDGPASSAVQVLYQELLHNNAGMQRRLGGIAMNSVKKFVGRKFSDFFSGAKTCSTRMMGNQVFVCTVRKPSPRYCEHSLSMGSGFICKHPDRLRFVDK
jgi:hypothetical protein